MSEGDVALGGNGKRQSTLYLQVAPQGSKAETPRFLAVPGALSLHNLAEVITEAFELSFGSPYEFSFGFGSPLRPRETPVEAALEEPGRELLFRYDETHRFRVRRIEPGDGPEPWPHVGEG